MKQKVLDMLPLGIYLRVKRLDYEITHRAQFEVLQNMRIKTTEDGYSYQPFDRYKTIFVHIPKCAGVAVNRTLFGNLGGGHATLDEYVHTFESRCIATYFKFTVVRNPWDRLVSAFFFLKSGGMYQSDRTGFRREFGDSIQFRDFVKAWVNRNNIWRFHQFRPQYHYMLEKRGKVNLDFVAFLENIDADFVYIAKRLGVTAELVKSNASKHSSYMDYYDDETRDIAAEAYAEDIQLLGYNFDNSSLRQQLASRDSGKVYSLNPQVMMRAARVPVPARP